MAIGWRPLRTGLRPDLVVVDLMMPYLDGLEVCRRLRSAGDRTPILVLTARDQVDDRVAGLDAGADDYLIKPFALAELRARLRARARHDAGGAARPAGRAARPAGRSARPADGSAGGPVAGAVAAQPVGRRGRAVGGHCVARRGQPRIP